MVFLVEKQFRIAGLKHPDIAVKVDEQPVMP